MPKQCNRTGKKGHNASAQENSLHHANASIPSQSNPSKPTVLLLSIGELDEFEDHHPQLYTCLRNTTTLQEATTASAASRLLSMTPPPSAVIITHTQHGALLDELVQYTRAGGRVVAGFNFPIDLPPRHFFQRWGLAWARKDGDRTRTTFALNPAGTPAPLRAATLARAYSTFAVPLAGVAPAHAVYAAAGPDSGCAAAWARVGAGYIGYVGDLDADTESVRLVLEMCGVDVRAGGLGRGAREMQPGRPGRSAPAAGEPGEPGTERRRRAREDEVEGRRERRVAKAKEKREAAETLKEEGNALFKRQEYLQAARKYRRAALIGGPRPVYLTNLAAALLKTDDFELAESAATRALAYEPQNLKARYRRALARRGCDDVLGAVEDLRCVLRLDPGNETAQIALGETLGMLSRMAAHEDDVHGVEETPYAEDDAPQERASESDSSEFWNEGNGTPCRYLNTRAGGCRHGAGCRWRHAPDARSVRDELGRNVCALWLLGACAHGARCWYAHDRTYLPRRGWWADKRHVRKWRPYARAMSHLSESERGAVMAIMPFCAAHWREDDWALPRYEDREEDGFGHLVHAPMLGFDGDRSAYGMFGLGEEDVEELLAQGVMPWDEDALDVLDVLNGSTGWM